MSELLDFILHEQADFKSKARLTSLYSDFAPLRRTNPDGFTANLSAWRDALTKSAHAGLLPGANTLTLDARGQSLEKELDHRDGGLGRPAALGVVLDDMTRTKDLVPIREFANARSSIYTSSKWTPQIQLPTVWSGARWALQQLGLWSDDNSQGLSHGTADEEFVYVPMLKEAADAVVNNVKASTRTPSALTFSLDTFTESFSGVLAQAPSQSSSPANENAARHLTAQDITLLLTYLSRDIHVAATATDAQSGKTTIRFANDLGDSNTTRSVPPITQTDTTIASLNTLQRNLTQQSEQLERSVSMLSTQLQAKLAAHAAKPELLQLLRRRKAAEATLAERQASLAQIENVISSIDDAASHVEIVRALEASSGVLKSLNREVGGVERVDRINDALYDETARVQEVGQAIGEAGKESAASTVDESEVEAEFESLLQETEAKESADKVAALPDAPNAEVERQQDSKEAEENVDDELQKSLGNLSLADDNNAAEETEGATATGAQDHTSEKRTELLETKNG